MQNIENIFQKENRPFLSVFELDVTKLDSDLDEAILNGFLQAKETNHISDVFSSICKEFFNNSINDK